MRIVDATGRSWTVARRLSPWRRVEFCAQVVVGTVL
ncbi:hypothetical protein SaccyDRAFT_0606 [Saccharomonospora cyanea NA-134]|uniref:Uncharacterized protein n=1 Tax=Saccharomonospora cyanea NA-134 TaxID=882082 RepID=H5XH63_9PSEU|nr:hypothetical protein SaccyDRAFT_0606 [Saccharomonospora cyanea NA-134]